MRWGAGIVLAGAVVAVIVAAAVIATVWTPYPVDGFDMANRFALPSLTHPLGTDQYGRDVVSMLMAGARTSLGVAAGAVVIGVGIGAPLGLAAAGSGRWGRSALMLGGDIVFAFPALIVAAILTTFRGPGSANALIAIGIFYIPVFMRLVAASARRVLSLDFVDAARLSGKGPVRIALEHVAPLVAPIVMTQAATQFAIAILIEAGLSYVGLGAQAAGGLVGPDAGRGADADGTGAAARALAGAGDRRHRARDHRARRGAEPPPRPPLRRRRLMLRLDHLCASAGRHTLVRDVTLRIRPGERVAIVGASGSGKSLTARAMLGLAPAGVTYTGSVRIDGHELLGMPDRALARLRGRVVSMVFQEPATALNPVKRVGSQIDEAIRLHSDMPAGERARRVMDLLEKTGLAEAGVGPERYPHELSGGQRQRVAIAMAVALSPRIVVADEPTSALDAVTSARVLDLLEALTAERGTALVLITHDLAVARRAERIVVMADGGVAEVGTDVLTHPRSEAGRALAASRTVTLPPPGRCRLRGRRSWRSRT